MVNLLPDIRLAQSILKRKFPSVGKPLRKPLQKQSPQKGPLKNISPTAYFQNFTVPTPSYTPTHHLNFMLVTELQRCQNNSIAVTGQN